jgi:hypothetical protein
MAAWNSGRAAAAAGPGDEEAGGAVLRVPAGADGVADGVGDGGGVAGRAVEEGAGASGDGLAGGDALREPGPDGPGGRGR